MDRYSERLPWSAPPNSFSRLLAQERSSGKRLIDLSISNPTEIFSNYPHSEIAKAYGSIADFGYHPDPFGTLAARGNIARWYAERGIRVKASQIALTASTSEAYSLLFKMLLNPGEEILISTPSYPLFEYLAKLDGVELRPYRLLYDGSWHIDFDSIAHGLSKKTRAIIVVNPNNPTGSFLKRDECERLEKLALENGLSLIADEVFMEYQFADSPERVTSFIGRDTVLSFSLNGLSKSAAMPQMKLGWIAVNGPANERTEALEKLELLLDTYLSVGTPVQNALADLLAIGSRVRDEILKRLQINWKALGTMLREGSVHALHCEGGWTVILRVPNIWSEDIWVTRLLQEYSVIVQPGYFFDMPMDGCLIISLLAAPERFSEGVERLARLAQTA